MRTSDGARAFIGKETKLGALYHGLMKPSCLRRLLTVLLHNIPEGPALGRFRGFRRCGRVHEIARDAGRLGEHPPAVASGTFLLPGLHAASARK